MAPSRDPNEDAISAAADAGRNAEARSVLAEIDKTVFAARRSETRADRRRRVAAFVTALFSDA